MKFNDRSKYDWFPSNKTAFIHLYKYFACLSVFLYPVNFKPARPTFRAQFFMGPHVTQGRFMDDRIFKNLQNSIFENFENPQIFQ